MTLGDNQLEAAIGSTTAFQSKPGHYLVDAFHDDLQTILPEVDGRKMMIRWSTGHIGITGKESSARRVFSDIHDLPRSLLTKGRTLAILLTRKSVLKQLFNNVIKNEARELTRKFPCYPKFRSVEPSTPSKHFASIINELTRRHNSKPVF